MFEKDSNNELTKKLKRKGASTLLTKDGAKGVEEAIDFLFKQEPQDELKWSQLMSKCSDDHASFIGKKGLISHESDNAQGTDQGTKQRLRYHGNVIGCYGENIAVYCNSAIEVVMQLIVDDGRYSKSHRNNFFQPDFKVMSCSTTEHS